MFTSDAFWVEGEEGAKKCLAQKYAEKGIEQP
jgi:hypothetical protein